MGSVCKINPLRTMRIIVMVWYEGALVAYLSYAQIFGRPLPSINKSKEKEIEMNFTDGDGFDLTYYNLL